MKAAGPDTIKYYDEMMSLPLEGYADLVQDFYDLFKKELGKKRVDAAEGASHDVCLLLMRSITKVICGDADHTDNELDAALAMWCLLVMSLDLTETAIANLGKMDIIEPNGSKKEEEGEECNGCCPACGGECEPYDTVDIDGEEKVVCTCPRCHLEWLS